MVTPIYLPCTFFCLTCGIDILGGAMVWAKLHLKVVFVSTTKKVVLIHLLRPPCGPSYAWLSMRPSVHQSILVLLHSASLPWRRRRRSFLLDPNPPHCKKGAQSRTTVKTIIKGHVLNVCWWDGWPGSSTDSENENFPHYLVLTHSLIVNVCRGRTFSKQCAKNVKTDADLAPFAKTIFH